MMTTVLGCHVVKDPTYDQSHYAAFKTMLLGTGGGVQYSDADRACV